MNRIVLITGGSRGLGRSMAEALAAAGTDVIITYHSAEAQAHEVVKGLEAKGRRAAALRLDVRQASGFAAFAEQVKDVLARRFGEEKLDALVNNAGTGLSAPFAETTEAQFDEMVNTHLKSTFFLTQKLVPLIADGGQVLNVSSGLTRFSFPGYAAYGTMKGAVETLTRYLAKELGGRKIRVNVLAPGAIMTDFGGGHLRENAQMQGMLSGLTALGRVGVADDIGPAVAALTSPELRWMNGQRIELSGGIFL